MSKRLSLVSLVALLGLFLLQPFQLFGLTPQEREDLKNILGEYRSIQKLLLEKLQTSEEALTKAQTYSEALESQKQELTSRLEELGKQIRELELLLETSKTSMEDLKSGLKIVEQERDFWRIAGIGGLILGGVSIIILLLGGSK